MSASTGQPSLEDASGREVLDEARRLLAAGDLVAARRWAAAVVDVSEDLSVWTGAAAVVRRCAAASTPGRTAKVAVVGSSTTSQLAALLPLACARARLHVEVYEAPYGQVRQEVLDPGSALYAFDPDFVVLAVHDADVHFPSISQDAGAAVDAALGDLRALWTALAERSRATVLQFTLPVPPEQPLGHLTTTVPGSRQRLLQELNLQLALSLPPSVVLVDCARLAAAMGTRTWFDPRYWHLAKQAVSPAAMPVLVRQVAAVLAASAGLSRKCLVLDLDNTLWGGVLGEDGVQGLQLGEGAEGEAFTAFQEYVLELKQKGVVLAVCSKNDESLVRDAFAQIRGMRLTIEDVAVLSAGWDDKPAQLRRIAADLGLGLDALVLADDNPVERESVRQLVPEVDVVRLPRDPAGYVRALADYPWFETTRLTQEDSARTEQYRARAAAAAARSDAPSLDEFLSSLDMEAVVGPVAEEDLARVAQLVAKTNQFNLTSRRRSQGELEQLIGGDHVVDLTARLRDRFADHGLVAVLLAERVGDDLVVDTWLMSCRVIGRTLEHALLGVLLDEARRRGCGTVRASWVPTPKNGLVEHLLPGLGFQFDRAGDDGATYWHLEVGRSARMPTTHVRLLKPDRVSRKG